jgi:hypothetical protein
MADRRTLSQVVKRTERGVGEAEISRRSAQESFASYHPYPGAGDSETKMVSGRSGSPAMRLKGTW